MGLPLPFSQIGDKVKMSRKGVFQTLTDVKKFLVTNCIPIYCITLHKVDSESETPCQLKPRIANIEITRLKCIYIYKISRN